MISTRTWTRKPPSFCVLKRLRSTKGVQDFPFGVVVADESVLAAVF